MGYPAAGVAGAAGYGYGPTYGGYFGTAAFALVLFILLVIILRAGY
ncbi:sporulation protein YjcZ [Cohnella hongkongensis]|uniref:Sporulation protein YjcZ n=1 Tax=Cohnella hongkongensis TaxID=178337 RepID=A0ABV9FB93_9BACL